MIHVDVHKQSDGVYAVQTSVDGSPWYTQYSVYPQVDKSDEESKRDAEYIARIFLQAVRFAGREARGTSCGYGL